MKNFRKKKPMTKNKECLAPFVILPVDLVVDILMKLPVKSIAKLIFVSKQWSSIILNKDFTELYITRSSSQLRFLFIYENMKSQFLESCSQKEPSSDYQRLEITNHVYMQANNVSTPVRGLICLRNGTELRIGNPSTGQFLTLPRVKTRRKGVVSFFGYDPLNDVYKVLSMTVLYVHQNRGSTVVSDEHQVFTLGPKQKWRKIVCKHPHLPPNGTIDKGICINGVVYYYSWIKNEGSVICFDLTSEDFSVVKLPEDITHLVNYCGKIALCSKMMYDGRLDMWVLQDAKKQEWSKVSHLVPSWEYLVGTQKFRFEGTLNTGELIFVPHSMMITSKSYFLVSYDPKENNAKRVEIEGIRNYFVQMDSYFNHVESPMILSNEMLLKCVAVESDP